MKYYKLTTDDTFIGIVTSQDFLTYQALNNLLNLSNETVGLFVEYLGKLYRDTWMQELPSHNYNFTQVYIHEITKEEYDILAESIEHNEEIIILPPHEDHLEEEIIYPNVSLEFVRISKINEMSYICLTTIEKGFDLWISDNQYHHFSLTTQDQLNLMAASTLLETVELIPYHADGEPSKYYTVDEMRLIIAAANLFKTYHTAYYNSLKNYINSLSTIEEIAAITYGTKIPEEYQTEVLKTIELEMISYENH